MQKTYIIFLIFFSTFSFSQTNEDFCNENKNGSFFPLTNDFKKVVWRDTFYFERKNTTKEINGKTYIEFEQESENSGTTLRYLREENGIVYEYEKCCENETIRYDPKFVEGHIWKKGDEKGEFKIITYNGHLKTPFCSYQNLLVIEGELDSKKFKFYYLRGFGYVGATEGEKLISYVTVTPATHNVSGGLNKFNKYIIDNFRMPNLNNFPGGKEIVEFTIKTDGTVGDIKIIQDIGYGVGKQFIKILKNSPKWTPGVKDGKPVDCTFTLPIIIPRGSDNME
jgi:hypothetical protein